MRWVKHAVVATALSCLALSASAQQPIAYPAKGQSPQQQQKDTGECQVWAKNTTGVDPNVIAQQLANQAPPPQQSSGSHVRGAAKGAVIGGVVGGIGGRGGEGAAAGAVVGLAASRQRERERQQAYGQQQQAAQQQASSQLATFNRAFAACMSGRGYSIQ
jgi:uncharacterized protein YcfJ